MTRITSYGEHTLLNWTDEYDLNTRCCNSLHLYCFQQIPNNIFGQPLPNCTKFIKINVTAIPTHLIVILNYYLLLPSLIIMPITHNKTTTMISWSLSVHQNTISHIWNVFHMKVYDTHTSWPAYVAKQSDVHDLNTRLRFPHST